MLVAIVALLSLGGSTLMTQSAALGVTFARACAAQEAQEQAPTSAPCLRRTDDDGRGESDIHALGTAGETPETVLRRERETPTDLLVDEALFVASTSNASTVRTDREQALDPSVFTFSGQPPSRARARLMVFLN